MTITIISRPGVSYPNDEGYYSPSDKYPEYRYNHLSKQTNLVYELVRKNFAQAKLDSGNFGTDRWNPLGDLIKEGSSVFVLCNFVKDRGHLETQESFLSKCTHGSVLRVLLDYLLIAIGPKGKITLGNAPLQSCDWDKVINQTGTASVLNFYKKIKAPVFAQDLRHYKTKRDITGRILETSLTEGEGVAVNLKSDSLFACINQDATSEIPFRIADYDPKQLEAHHSGQNHVYMINREILSADVIVSVPKLKTHEKVGVTLGLKGFVGIVCHKDCLPHHRLGGPARGGDEYPYDALAMRLTSMYSDWVQRCQPNQYFNSFFQILDHSIRRILRYCGMITSGAWHGNDTCWRMALDLARIAHYADARGLMQDTLQRKQLLLIDGIIAGEGNGPLSPSPVKAGTLLFSDDIAVGDWIACRMMGYNPRAIPLVDVAQKLNRYPLRQPSLTDLTVSFNGDQVKEDQLQPIMERPFLPPTGWRKCPDLR